MPAFLLSASILSANFRHLEEEIRAVEQAGADWIHVDIMDGQFVPNISMGPFIVEFCREVTTLPIDAHLMIINPERHIRAFAKAGATYLTIHPENNPNILRTLQEIRELGCRAGAAINPGTPACLAEQLMPFLDLALIMTVNPGYSGQAYISEMKGKITQVRQFAQAQAAAPLVQVDGGIHCGNVGEVVQAGADVVVSASAIFKHPAGIQAGVRALRAARP